MRRVLWCSFPAEHSVMRYEATSPPTPVVHPQLILALFSSPKEKKSLNHLFSSQKTWRSFWNEATWLWPNVYMIRQTFKDFPEDLKKKKKLSTVDWLFPRPEKLQNIQQLVIESILSWRLIQYATCLTTFIFIQLDALLHSLFPRWIESHINE